MDHGGNLDQAIAQYGGAPEDWIDLSTGINRQPYPIPPLPPEAWAPLPTASATARLIAAARAAYATEAAIAPLAGAQQAIQLIPQLWPPGQARILAPTYNEHAHRLRAAGWQVTEVTTPEALPGADLAILVSPNNPDGRITPTATLLQIAATTRLIVDESFADPTPHSLAPRAGQPGLIVLRSFGKFYGLAGLRLGFALGHPSDIDPLREAAGPWPASGPALHIGAIALSDTAWARATTRRLTQEAPRLDTLATAAQWRPLGGTPLFRLYDTPDASAAQHHLAQHRIWSRRFPYSPTWLRLGLPGAPAEWSRLATALARP